MTTARAWFLKSSLGGGLYGFNRRSFRRAALSDGPVNQPYEDDDPEGELVNRDIAQESRDRDVRQSAQRWVLTADRSVARPQEVDLHGDAPDKAKDVEGNAPAAQLERRGLLRPAPEPGAKNREVAQDVREVDHPGRADGDGARACVVEKWKERQQADDDAGPNWSVERRID